MLLSTYAQEIKFEKGSKTCILIFHGLADTPFEMRELGESLFSLDVDVYIPLLPRHGIDAEYLALITREEIDNWALDLVSEIKGKYERVIVVGHSCGAGLTILSTIKTAIPYAIIVSSVGGIVTRKLKFFVWIVKRFKLKFLRFSYKKERKIEAWPEEYIQWREKNFRKAPVNLFISAIDIWPKIAKEIGKISVPIMVVNGTKDIISPVEAVDIIMQKVSSIIKKGIIVKGAGHSVFASEYRFEIIEHIRLFISEVLDEKTRDGKEIIVIG
ncbi:MAG: alpha/beta fold hydrolase [Candidatus Heimdallarchaeota archaeon]|nr:alpha/beta fold hydrolase [Candidatus Heimdallarchaeota archaeon]